MTLFDICKNVLLNNKINVSSIKHLKLIKYNPINLNVGYDETKSHFKYLQ